MLLKIHPENPSPRMIKIVVDCLRDGGVIIYPTDTIYGIGCNIFASRAVDRVAKIKGIRKEKANFSFVCKDLSNLSDYVRQINSATFKILKRALPGPYTFILQATRDLPRRLQNEKRKTVGIRIPEHPIAQALLEELGEPLMSSTLIMPGDELPMTDCDEMAQRLSGEVDLIVDGGSCGIEPTTVIDLTGSFPVILREGKGSTEDFN